MRAAGRGAAGRLRVAGEASGRRVPGEYLGGVSTTRSAPFGRAAVLAAVVLSAPLAGTRLAAQPAAASRLGPYERALRLVESGRGPEGRSLTDSLVAAAVPGSPALAEALWWRAALAASAATAERDLRRLLGEVPASPRSGPAAVRLAQLALLRDRPEEAVALLDPLTRGRAGDPVRPLAGYWLARARLERRDATGACAAIDAASGVPVLDVDLARQLAGLRRRVAGCGAAVAVAPPPVAPAPSVAAAPAGVGAVAAGAPAESSVVTTRSAAGALATGAPVPAAAAAPPAAASSAAPSTVPSAAPASSTPAPSAPPAAAPPTPGSTTRAPARAPALAGPVFAVQVAAYDTRGGADALAARLRGSGLDAFTEGQGAAGDLAPFRVKVGRFATRASAAASLAAIRGRGLTGFVTTARQASSPAPR